MHFFFCHNTINLVKNLLKLKKKLTNRFMIRTKKFIHMFNDIKQINK